MGEKGLIYGSYGLTIASYVISLAIYIVIFGIYYDKKKKYEYAWFCTKINTVRNMVKENSYKNQIYNYFTEDGQIKGLETSYYDLLKLPSKNTCIGKYKQCGLLDSLEHRLCIDKDFPCPINEIVADYVSEKYYYLTKGYNIRKVDYLNYNYNFYYANYSNYGNAIVTLKRTFQSPKFIDYENLRFETDFINKFFGVNNSESDLNLISEKAAYKRRAENVDYKEIVETVGLFLSFFKDLINKIKEYIEDRNFEEFLDYIVDKIENDEKNKDIYYIPIGDNCYIKNYIGFDSSEDIDTFMHTNFDIYKRTFPDKLSAVFAIIGFILFLAIIIICIILLCEYSGKEKLLFIFNLICFFIHIAYFIGYMCSFSSLHAAYHDKNVLSKVKTIKADEFITDFLKEFEKKMKSYHFVNSVIACLTISIFLQFISFFLLIHSLC